MALSGSEPDPRPAPDPTQEGCAQNTHLNRFLDQLSVVAGAVHHAHQQGYLHLDLKVGHLVRGTHGQLFVVDWGTATERAHWGRVRGHVVGTTSFMSPEQAAGGPFDERTDVYGLGACLYAALVGRAPHGGPRSERVARLKRARTAPHPGHALAEKIPHSLLSLARRCLDPRPDARPSSAAEVQAALDGARHGTDLLARHTFAPATPIVRAGEHGDTAWFIESGTVAVHHPVHGRVGTLGPGDVFGELAPILGRPRTATVTAESVVVAREMTGDHLRDAVAFGRVGGQVIGAITRRLVALEARMNRGE